MSLFSGSNRDNGGHVRRQSTQQHQPLGPLLEFEFESESEFESEFESKFVPEFECTPVLVSEFVFESELRSSRV